MGIRELLEIIKSMDDPLKQDILMQRAAKLLDIPFAALKDELARTAVKISIPYPARKDKSARRLVMKIPSLNWKKRFFAL